MEAAAAAVEAVVEGDRHDSGAHGGVSNAGSDNGRIGGGSNDGGAGDENAL